MQHNSSSSNTHSVKQMQLIKISCSFTHLIAQREIQRTPNEPDIFLHLSTLKCDGSALRKICTTQTIALHC